jgi:tetratricopeptide (TPR) repeat protein
MDWSTFALVGRTFARAFPNSLLILTEPSGTGSDFLMVGFKGEDGLTLENARKNFPFVQNSKNISLSDPRLLYRLIVSEDLESLFGPGPVNTDSRPLLEFSAPKLIYQNDPVIAAKIQSGIKFKTATQNIIHQVTTDIEDQIDFAAYALSLYSPFVDMVDLSRAVPSQKERYWGLLETHYTNNMLDKLVLSDSDLMRRCRLAQIKNLEERIDHLPDKALSYAHLGNLYLEENMLEQSIKSSSRSLEINPDIAAAHNNLGCALMKQDKLDLAITHFRETLRIEPDHATANQNIGSVLVRNGQLDEAVLAYSRAAELEPDNPGIQYKFGLLLADQKRIDEAVIHLKKALEIKPDMTAPYITLGKIFIKKGELDNAAKYFEAALKIKPDLTNILADLGKIFMNQGNNVTAAKYLRKALEVEPGQVEILNNLAWILATYKESGLRDPDEAIQLAEQACKLTDYKKPDLLDTLAVAYASASRFPEAVNTAEKAMELAVSYQQKQLSEAIRKRLLLFKARSPYIEGPS